MTDKLNELMRICGVNDITFIYQKNGDINFIEESNEPEKTITVNICDYEDKELDGLLSRKIEELKELFK